MAGRQPASLPDELAAVQRLCDWLLLEGYVSRDPCAGVRLPRSVPAKTAIEPSNLREALALRGLAPRTVDCYYRVIVDAMGWCEDRGETLAYASPKVITAYVGARPQTFSTQKAIRSSFIHYWAIVKRKDPPLGLLSLPPRPRMVCRALEGDEAKNLARVALERNDGPGLAVILGLYQALRREEIATLRWENFDDRGWLTVTGKGGLTASIPVRATVTEMLALRERHDDFIFPGQTSGRSVTPTTVWNWVRLVAKEAGLSGVTPHRLRHTALATANDNTGDLRSVQAFARHADPRVTAGYTRATSKRLTAVVNSIDY
jgi:integrase